MRQYDNIAYGRDAIVSDLELSRQIPIFKQALELLLVNRQDQGLYLACLGGNGFSDPSHYHSVGVNYLEAV